MTEPLNHQKINKSPSQEISQTMQTLSKKIPQHRRSMYEIEAKEVSYKKLNKERNVSQRLKFEPFCYRRKMSVYQEVGHISRILRTSSKITKTLNFLFDITRDETDKAFLHYSEQIKKMRALKTLDFYLSGSEITDLALYNMSIGFRSLRSLQYLRIRLVECGYIDDPSIKFVAKGLKRLISLQTLDVSFDEYPRADFEKIESKN